MTWHQVHEPIPVDPFNMFINVKAAQRNNAPRRQGCRKVGGNLVTAPGCCSPPADRDGPPRASALLTQDAPSPPTPQRWESWPHPGAETLGFGAEECPVQLWGTHNRKWRERGSDWLKLCRSAGPRSPIGGRTGASDSWRGQVRDAHPSIIDSATNQLLKRRVWFYMYGYMIFKYKKFAVYKNKTASKFSLPKTLVEVIHPSPWCHESSESKDGFNMKHNK